MSDIRITRIRIDKKLVDLINPTEADKADVKLYILEDNKIHPEVKERVKRTLGMVK